VTKAEIGIGVLAAGTVLALVWDPFIGSFLHRERNRGEVLALYQAIQPGMAGSVVEEEKRSGRYPHLTFHGGKGSGWYVSTPLEFGAKNWVLVVDAVDGRVTAVRIRTEDGLHDHPAQAPSDKKPGATARQRGGEGAVEQ
jgi:hypothetical protein